MAGSFGYEQGHYEVSQACGERVLFPAVRGTAADDLVVAPGFICRHQIADFCDNRRSLHTAELLATTGDHFQSAVTAQQYFVRGGSGERHNRSDELTGSTTKDLLYQ
jgi:hypothetical protein